MLAALKTGHWYRVLAESGGGQQQLGFLGRLASIEPPSGYRASEGALPLPESTVLYFDVLDGDRTERRWLRAAQLLTCVPLHAAPHIAQPSRRSEPPG